MNFRRLGIFFTLAVIACAVLSATQAQIPSKGSDDTLARIGLRIGDFLRDIASDSDPALDALLARSPLLKDSAKITRLRENLPLVLQKQGTLRSVDQLKLERVGPTVVRGTYLYNGEDFPLAWTFTFYRPDEDHDWVVIALQFHADYDKLPPTP